MKPIQIIVNALVICLLLLVSWSFLRLCNQSTEISQQHSKIEKDLSLLKTQLSEAEASTTYLATTAQELVDSLPHYLDKLRQSYSELSARISALERKLGSEDSTNAEQGGDLGNAEAGKPQNESVLLSPELKKKAEDLGYPAGITNFQFDEFLKRVISSGLLPFSMPENLSNDSLDTIRQYFEIYKATAQTLTAKGRLVMNRSIEKYNETGNYTEFPINANRQEIEEKIKALNLTHGAVLVRLYPQLGVKRHYFFPFDEHPDLGKNQNVLENARNQMIRDIYEYGQSLKPNK